MSAHPMDTPETAEEAAARWFALQRSGEMSAREADAFRLWLSGDPAHGVLIAKMEQVWGLARVTRDAPDMMALLEEEERGLRGRNRNRLALGAVAACLVVAAGAGVAFKPWTLFTEYAPEQEFRTGIGQTTAISLDDGSIVTLDTDTVLRARETARKRSIELVKGRAFFQVAKDPSRPFIVAAAGKTVTAIGTAFDVRLDPGQMQVTLVEGRVAVEEPDGQMWKGQSRSVMAGWRLVAVDDARWSVTRIDAAQETSWLHGRLFFDDAPLATVAAELNRYSSKKIIIRDAVIGSTPVLGGFRTGDVEDFVRIVEAYKFARVVSDTPQQVELGAP